MNARSIPRATLTVIASLVLFSAASGAAASRHPQPGSHDGTANAYPRQIATAPDGSLWFGENRGIEHLLPSGQFHLFAVPGAPGTFGEHTPGSLVVDARGTVWFTSGQDIGRLENRRVLSMIPVPLSQGKPTLIMKGPDGTLWCVSEIGSTSSYGFGRISSDGRVHPAFIWPKRGSIPRSFVQLDAIAVGKNDRFWFAETFVTDPTQGSGPTFVGYLDNRMRIVRFPMPKSLPHVCPSRCVPSSILIGTDGTIWFGLLGDGLGQITAKGVRHISVLPRSVIAVSTLAPDSDGGVWFGTIGTGIGHMDHTGRVKFFELSQNRTEAYEGSAPAADGSLWFTIGCTNSIGHITVTGATTVFHIPGTIADAGPQCPGLP